MKDWAFGTEPGNWISMSVISDGSYGIPEGLVFSCPVTCQDFEYQIVKNIDIDNYTKQQIANGIEELEEERDQATEDTF
jgi:malate dehydrogenase